MFILSFRYHGYGYQKQPIHSALLFFKSSFIYVFNITKTDGFAYWGTYIGFCNLFPLIACLFDLKQRIDIKCSLKI